MDNNTSNLFAICDTILIFFIVFFLFILLFYCFILLLHTPITENSIPYFKREQFGYGQLLSIFGYEQLLSIFVRENVFLELANLRLGYIREPMRAFILIFQPNKYITGVN